MIRYLSLALLSMELSKERLHRGVDLGRTEAVSLGMGQKMELDLFCLSYSKFLII